MHFSKHSISLSVTTAKTTSYSTNINGLLYGVLFENSTASTLNSTNLVTMYNDESTGWILFKFNPSTTPHFYYPRSHIHTSTAKQLSQTTNLFIEGDPHCLAYDRVKFVITNSSGGASARTGTLKLYIQGD